MLTTELIQKIRKIELFTRRLVNDTFAGEYNAVFKGRGMAFDEVRQYAAGDEVRTIDWNVTARMGEPYVKRFVEERELTVMLVVDASASGSFGSVGRFKRELAAELTAVLAFAATSNNDKVGLLIFTDRVELFVPPRKGRRHVLRLVRELLAFEPTGRSTDIKMALDTLNRMLKRRAILFLVSDFWVKMDGSQLALQSTLTITNKRHDVVAIDLQDPLETNLPDVGLLAVQDAETGALAWVDTSNQQWRKDFTERVTTHEMAKQKAFRRAQVDHVRLNTAEDYVLPLVGFFQRRLRRLTR
jgi:uncharacterized protein (DUF58 family)